MRYNSRARYKNNEISHKLYTHFGKSMNMARIKFFGLIDTNSRLALLQILEDFYERKSIIITSQLPVKSWYDYIGEPTLSDAIMDRITSNSMRIEILGESLRKKERKN